MRNKCYIHTQLDGKIVTLKHKHFMSFKYCEEKQSDEGVSGGNKNNGNKYLGNELS